MERKKYLYAVLGLVFVLSMILMAGCGGKNDKPADTTQQSGAQDDQKPQESAAPEIKFPEKPVTVVVPYDAGGGTDQAVRALAATVESHLGGKVIVVNKPGAAGAVGMKEVFESKADGYTLIVPSNGIVINHLLGKIEQNYDDFEIVSAPMNEPMTLAVGKSAPWTTLQEFVEHAKNNTVKIGSGSPGGAVHTAASLMGDRLGAQFDLVTSGGGAAQPVIMAAGGHIDGAVGSPAEVKAQLDAGNLRVLAVASEERVKILPDVPTFKELGYDILAGSSKIVLAPKGTPKEILDILTKAFMAGTDEPKFKNFIDSTGSEILNYDPVKAGEYFANEQKMFEQILKSSGQLP